MIVSDEKLAKSIMDAQPESVIWYHPIWNNETEPSIIDFELRYCNAATAKLFRLPQESLIGTRLKDSFFIPKDAQLNTFRQCLEVWKSGDSQEFTNYVPHLNRYFMVLRSKLLGGIISVGRDCTESMQSQLKLKHQADLLNRILDTSTNAIYACEAVRDATGTITDLQFLKVNQTFLQLTGFTEEEAMQTSFLDLFPTAVANGLFSISCTVIETGEPFHKELLYKGPKLERWLDVSMAKLSNSGLVVSFTDITDIKKDKESILAASKFLQDAIDTSQTGITVIVPVWSDAGEMDDFRYKLVNKTFSEVVGRKPADLIGTLLSKWFPLYKAQGTFDRYKQLYNSGEPQHFELHYVKNGYDVWVDVLAKKEGDEIFVTFHDFTSLKKAQLAQEALVEDLKRSNANLEDFAFAASHDLQEPLRKIHFFSHKLRNDYLSLYDKSGVDMFLRMEASTQRMRELINDLLDYSQLGGNTKVETIVDLNAVVQDVLVDLETSIQEKQAQFTIDALPEITGDQSQLRQLFYNLISNAIKYSHAERIPFVSIKVKAVTGRQSGFALPFESLHKSYYQFEITDNGIGFLQDDAEKIFNVFQRLHSREEYSGTGIGLAIVKKVIDHHQGCIEALSGPGAGACFRFLLPY